MSSFLIADLHIGHVGMTKFLRDDGSKLRPYEFVEEHDDALIHNWNKVVNDEDLVYILGDFTINKKHIHWGKYLKGRKRLVMGNHDNGSIQDYIDAGFESLHGSIELKKYNVLLTHIPVHVDQIQRYRGGNIHGHLHSHRVIRPFTQSIIDPHYLCVSAEHINFTPINLEVALELLASQQDV